jgi:hypothetical protein
VFLYLDAHEGMVDENKIISYLSVSCILVFEYNPQIKQSVFGRQKKLIDVFSFLTSFMVSVAHSILMKVSVVPIFELKYSLRNNKL